MMYAELREPESGWTNFGELTRREKWNCCWEKGWRAYVSE